MRAVIQRVRQARVEVDGQLTGAIDKGLLVFVAIGQQDGPLQVEKMAHKLAGLRVFADEQGRMNLNVAQAGGDLLVVSQFTLLADTRKGMRPGFSANASPEQGKAGYLALIEALRQRGLKVATGRFGADMQVHLVNDGPATFIVDID